MKPSYTLKGNLPLVVTDQKNGEGKQRRKDVKELYTEQHNFSISSLEPDEPPSMLWCAELRGMFGL